jgi:hypothetical protein
MNHSNPLTTRDTFHRDSAWERAANYEKEARPIRQVQKIKVTGTTDVVFFRSNTPMMFVAGETQEAIKSVTTSINGDTLVIDRQGGNIIIGRGGSIHVSGSGNRVSMGDFIGGRGTSGIIDAGKVIVGVALPYAPDVTVSGAADITLYDIAQQSLELKVSGAGDMVVFGTVGHLIAKVSGAGDIDASEVTAQEASLNISGAGDIKASVTDSVKARISGCGNAVIRGNPEHRDTKISGVGKIKFKKP